MGAILQPFLGIRNSWYSSMTSFRSSLSFIVGIPTEVFVAVGAMHYFVQFYNHNALVNKSGFLEHIMMRLPPPRSPRQKRAYLDRNFGGVGVLGQDFGTFQRLDDIPVELDGRIRGHGQHLLGQQPALVEAVRDSTP